MIAWTNLLQIKTVMFLFPYSFYLCVLKCKFFYSDDPFKNIYSKSDVLSASILEYPHTYIQGETGWSTNQRNMDTNLCAPILTRPVEWGIQQIQGCIWVLITGYKRQELKVGSFNLSGEGSFVLFWKKGHTIIFEDSD